MKEAQLFGSEMMQLTLIVSSVLHLISILLNGWEIWLLTVVRRLSNRRFLLADLAVTEIQPSIIVILQAILFLLKSYEEEEDLKITTKRQIMTENSTS